MQPAGHIELRKRKAAQNANAGKRAPLKVVDPLDKKKSIPRWLIWTFLLLLGGGCEFEPFLEWTGARVGRVQLSGLG
jgi:hypothetical protein